MVNIRTKGQTAERDVAAMLNAIIYEVCVKLGMPQADCDKALRTVQRNQNQTAVGGNDLTNCLGLSIEVKRQEELSINTWWKQCVSAARRNNELPVLIWKQSRKPWRVMTYGQAYLPGGGTVQVTMQISVEDFKVWFSHWAYRQIQAGALLRV